MRRTARELGVDLAAVTPTGPKGRITKDDLLGFLKGPAQPAAAAATGAGIPEIPAQDFSKFGPIDTAPLPRIKKVSGPFLHRSWLNVPHVTHNDEADITDLDRYRKDLDTAKNDRNPYRVTLLAFLVKACVVALKGSPSSTPHCPRRRTPHPQALLQHRHRRGHPGGLVVPVVTDADRKGIVELSREFMSISAKARDGKLGPSDMAGGTFTISSLGGIGGTSFTPIVNAPEVAILGVVRSKLSPVWNGTEFTARNMLPFPVLRPPRHRRCAGRPLRPTPVLPARRRPTAAAVTALAADQFDHGSNSMSAQEIKVPDIGDFSDIPVIEIHVAAGDTVAAEDPLVTLESDKATLDVPAPVAGTVTELRVAVGDTVSKGSVIMVIDAEGGDAAGSFGHGTDPAGHRDRSRAAGGRRYSGAGPPRTSNAATSTPRCSCSAPGRAATPQRSGPPTSASRSS